MFFADTSLPDASDPYGLVPGGWVTNSYAFIENPEDPLQQTNFGTSLGDGYTIPDIAVNWTAAEYENWNTEMLWGSAIATQQNDPTATWGYLVFQYGLRPTSSDDAYVWEYNTLVNVTATESGGLVTNRIVDQLFTAPEILWGVFSVAAEPSTDYLYLFGVSGIYLYVACVDWASATNVTSYEYYSGDNKWSTDPSAAAAIFTLPIQAGGYFGSGNVFWSPFYSTWMSIYMTSDQNEIYLIYSTTGLVQGPYSDPVEIFETCPTISQGVDCGNYAGNAYPFWRGTDASEVILSWSVNGGAETQMALVTFS